jgi:hypothetical protein
LPTTPRIQCFEINSSVVTSASATARLRYSVTISPSKNVSTAAASVVRPTPCSRATKYCAVTNPPTTTSPTGGSHGHVAPATPVTQPSRLSSANVRSPITTPDSGPSSSTSCSSGLSTGDIPSATSECSRSSPMNSPMPRA